jgi:hypothetical protein
MFSLIIRVLQTIVDGVAAPEDTRFLLIFASANRDEIQFSMEGRQSRGKVLLIP